MADIVYEGITEQTPSDTDSSDISISYSDGEVLSCLQHSDDTDEAEGTLHLKGTAVRHVLESPYLKEEEQEDITQILQRLSPCAFLIHPHHTTHVVKEADIAPNISFLTDGQYSVVYVTQSLLDDMKKTKVQSAEKICDICVFTTGRPTIVLTLVEDGMDGEDDNIFYNTHLARKITGLVRQEKLNNFSVVSGVISREKFSSRVEMEDFLQKRTQEALKLALPYSLNVDSNRWSVILSCFLNRILSYNSDIIHVVPLGQGSELFPGSRNDPEFFPAEMTLSLDEGGSSIDHSKHEHPSLHQRNTVSAKQNIKMDTQSKEEVLNTGTVSDLELPSKRRHSDDDTLPSLEPRSKTHPLDDDTVPGAEPPSKRRRSDDASMRIIEPPPTSGRSDDDNVQSLEPPPMTHPSDGNAMQSLEPLSKTHSSDDDTVQISEPPSLTQPSDEDTMQGLEPLSKTHPSDDSTVQGSEPPSMTHHSDDSTMQALEPLSKTHPSDDNTMQGLEPLSKTHPSDDDTVQISEPPLMTQPSDEDTMQGLEPLSKTHPSDDSTVQGSEPPSMTHHSDDSTMQGLEPLSKTHTSDDNTMQGLEPLSKTHPSDDDTVQISEPPSMTQPSDEDTMQGLEPLSKTHPSDESSVQGSEPPSMTHHSVDSTMQGLEPLSKTHPSDDDTVQSLEPPSKTHPSDDNTVQGSEPPSVTHPSDDDTMQGLEPLSKTHPSDDDTVQSLERPPKTYPSDDNTVQGLEPTSKRRHSDGNTVQSLEPLSKRSLSDDNTMQSLEPPSKTHLSYDDTEHSVGSPTKTHPLDDNTMQGLEPSPKRGLSDDDTMQGLESLSRTHPSDDDTGLQLTSKRRHSDGNTVQSLEPPTKKHPSDDDTEHIVGPPAKTHPSDDDTEHSVGPPTKTHPSDDVIEHSVGTPTKTHPSGDDTEHSVGPPTKTHSSDDDTVQRSISGEVGDSSIVSGQISPASQIPDQINPVGCTSVNITCSGQGNEVDKDGSSIDHSKHGQPSLHQRNIKKYRLNTLLPEGSPISIILIGKTGNGKSSTGNTIFWQDQLFESDTGFVSQTQTCKLEHGIVGGREFRVVDTPGNMDPNHKKRLLHEIGSAIFLCPDGYDAIVLVLKLTCMTDEEKEAVTQLKRLFRDPDLLSNHGILLFTGGDSYRKKIPLKEYIQQKGDEFVKQLMEECHDRVVLFNNQLDDEEKSSRQVIDLVNEIDELVRSNRSEKYTNSFFDEAEDLHSYIENTDLEHRSIYEKEKQEFEIKQQKKEEEERRKRKEMEERQRDLKMQQDLDRERFIKELQHIIRQGRKSNIKTQLQSKLKRTIVKWQREWILDVDKIVAKYEGDLSMVVITDWDKQGIRWNELLQTELQTIEVDLNEIFSKRKQQGDTDLQRKEQIQKNVLDELQAKKNLADVQWMKTCKQLMTAQSKVLQRHIGSKNTEQENEWMKTFRAKLGEYEASFNQETNTMILKAEAEFNDLVAEKVTLDLNWKHRMETLKDQYRLKWSSNLGTQSVWKDDLQRERKKWEVECQGLFQCLWLRVNKDMMKYLNDERQRQEMTWTVEIRQRGRDQLNDLKKEFKEVEKSKTIDQLKKTIQTDNLQQEKRWQQLMESRIETLCSEQENKRKKKGMDIYTKLTEKDVNADLAETMNSDMSHERKITIECWKNVVKTSVDEQCRHFEQKLTQKLMKAENDLLNKCADIYTEDAIGWVEKVEMFRKSWKRETKDAIMKKLRYDKEKLDKMIDGLKSFEEDWKTIVADERKAFESKWKTIYAKLSNPEDLVAEYVEKLTIRDTLENKIEKSRVNHEKYWLTVEERIKRSHLQTLQKKRATVIDADNVSNVRRLRLEIQKQNSTWRTEAKNFMLQKEIYWKTYVDGKREEFDVKFMKIMEKNMDEQGEKWKDMGMDECQRLVNRWKQHLRVKRIKEEKNWLKELKRLRENHEWKREVELKALRARWRKEDMNVIDQTQKSIKSKMKKKIREKRKKLETEWEERNQEQMETIVSSAMMEITDKIAARMDEKLKTIHERREMEENNWVLDLKKKRLDDQKSKLDEVCTKLFNKTFEELNTGKGGKKMIQSKLSLIAKFAT